MDQAYAITFDYHSHHLRCGHAVGEMRDYIERAYAGGMVSFGVSDHGPAYWLEGDHAKPHTQMALSWLPAYMEEARALQREYRGKLDVLVGLEADFIEGREDDLRRLLESYPLDYTLGSVHYALDRTIFRRDWHAVQSQEALFTDYYRQVALAARSGLFDILSHLTAVEAYSPPLPEELAAALYPPVADAVAESGCVVEINTSGFRKRRAADGGPGSEPFPNRRMLRLLLQRGVPLTFGADSHQPEEVGYGSAAVAALLKEFDLSPEAFELRSLPRAAARGEEAFLRVFRG